MDLQFDCFPAVEGLLAAELGILRKEYHGGSFEGRQCSRIVFNVDFLESHMRQLEFEQDPAEPMSQASYRLCSWGQGPVLTQFSIVCAAFMKLIRVYLASSLNLGTL